MSNTLAVVLRQASVRMISMVLCSVIVFAFVYGVSWSGFHWIWVWRRIPPFGDINGALFDFLFVALAVMLIFSNALILYSSLFASAEAAFLLSTPARDDQIFAYKYQGPLGFSSWGFLLLGSPVLLAFGRVYPQVQWPFYTLLPLFFLGFVLLPGSIEALSCLLVVSWIPQQRKQLMIALILGLVFLAGLWIYGTAHIDYPRTEDREFANRLLGRLSISDSPLFPTHWITRGLQTAGRGYFLWGPRGEFGALYYLALVWSNGLGWYVLTAWVAALLYRRGYNRVQTGSSFRGGFRKFLGQGLQTLFGKYWSERLLSVGLGFLDLQTRLLIVKDFRTFRRDPAQWAQVLIFTGLMALYVANVRRLFIADIDWPYQNGISLLNLATTGLLLCIYTGRFIFPMLSLEGRKFWILGLLPLRRQRLLWGKFVFSATGAVLIAEALVLLSDLMLSLPWFAVLLHMLTVAILAVGLSGLSVGLGTCLATFQETDPSKIAAGFGGTLNLIAGLLFLLVVISLMALPWHVYAAFLKGPNQPFTWDQLLLLLPALLGVYLGFLATWLPLRAGSAALERMEF